MNQAVNWEQACPTFVTTKVEGISVAHLQVVPGCVYLYMRKGVLFIISSFCIVMYEREHKWLNSKLVPVFYSQEHSWSALIGNQKYIFSLSLFISSSAYSASYVKAWQLSSNFKHSAKMIYIYIYTYREREAPQGTFVGLLQLFCFKYWRWIFQSSNSIVDSGWNPNANEWHCNSWTVGSSIDPLCASSQLGLQKYLFTADAQRLSLTWLQLEQNLPSSIHPPGRK